MRKFSKLILAMVLGLFFLTLAACQVEEVADIEFRTTDTHLQWRFEDEEEWTDIVELDAIQGPEGPEGPEGQDGHSAFEIYLEYYPGYPGTEEDWIKELARGELVVEIAVIYRDGHYEVLEFLKGEQLGESPYDVDWYLDEDFETLADDTYVVETIFVYIDETEYLHLVEERLMDDGSDFNPETGAYEPEEDHPEYGYMQYAANIVNDIAGDFIIAFEDVTADVVIYYLEVEDMQPGDRWLQVAYQYEDGTAIPAGNELRLTLYLDVDEDTSYYYVSEFVMTEEMYQEALPIRFLEERFLDDGSDFNPDTGAYEPDADHDPYGYLQYAANIEWDITGDIEVIFEDVTAGEVIFNPTLDSAEAQDRWLQVKYVYTDEEGNHTDTVIPVGNIIRVTTILTSTDALGNVREYVRISEFEMTQTMFENALTVTPQHTVFEFDYDLTGIDFTQYESQDFTFTIQPYEINELGYETVRLNVSVSGPGGLELWFDGTDVADVGYFGAEEGYSIPFDYEEIFLLSALTETPGEYTITLTLYDLDESEVIITTDIVIDVAEAEHSVYGLDENFDLQDLYENLVTEDIALTLYTEEVKDLGYDNARLNVSYTGPGTMQLWYDGDDVAATGYFGDEAGFELPANFTYTYFLAPFSTQRANTPSPSNSMT